MNSFKHLGLSIKEKGLMKFATASLLILWLFTEQSFGATNRQFRLRDVNVKQYADAVLALMSYSAILDLTASSLAINNTQSGNPSLSMTQLGGGATMSRVTPLYLEGAFAYSRYDPVFIATNGTEDRSIPVKWTSVTLQGGVGWDFIIAPDWVIRPVANLSGGYITSDLNVAKTYLGNNFDLDLDFFDGGSLTAGGLGAAIMLDYEHIESAYEIDFEMRYSYMHLESVGGSKSVAGVADSGTLNGYFRWRAPVDDWRFWQRPFRYVLEASHSLYYGDQAGVLGFDELTTLGAGAELDSSAYDVWITRTRLVGRYLFGYNVHGFSVGLACSF